MKFTNLRITGFKSFVETTDFEIREGLTGIVGPNGCGKSNLLEAMRWVMGATSAKALRGSGMGDVIFAGTSMRPARNWAEVTLTLDNSDRSAPAEYNDEPVLEVSRKILNKEGGTQSIYRINAKEVRAKDIQLLFADASSGANSPSLVRQGQVAELINAKPENRRRLLEEAAGVTGLHTRRHEAELRLRAAETNLERLDDVTGELESQKTTLARQARQATRYRNLSGDIRRAEAMAGYLRWAEAVEAMEEAASALQGVNSLTEETARAAAAAGVAQTAAHEALEPLRLEEAEAAAGLHRLTVARETLDEEAARARATLERLTAEIERLNNDETREGELLKDAQEAIEALAREEEGLTSRKEREAERLTAAAAAMKETAARLEDAEKAFEAESAAAAEIDARRRAAASALQEAARQVEKISGRISSLEREREQTALSEEERRALEEATAAFTAAEEAARAAELAAQTAEDNRVAAEAQENELRAPRQKAEQSLSELTAECDALKRVLAAGQEGDWPSLIEQIEVEPGYETALAAALGDDLNAALDEAAPMAWTNIGAQPLQSATLDAPATNTLPNGVAPLSRFVKGPARLTRRLQSIGLIAQEQGSRLQSELTPGARLVSREGDLWRWDGFSARAEAKTAAAIRLEQRNRLNALSADLERASKARSEARQAHDRAQQEVARYNTISRDARTLLKDAGKQVDRTRSALSAKERAQERAKDRLQTITDNLASLNEELREAQGKHQQTEQDVAALPPAEVSSRKLAEAKEKSAHARGEASEARAAHNDLAREAQMREARLEELARERGVWTTRRETAQGRLGDLSQRLGAVRTEKQTAEAAPDTIEEKKVALLDQIGAAEETRNAKADALAAATQQSSDADKTAKEAETAASEAREARARLDAQNESSIARVEEAASLARETCNAEPEALLGIAEHKEGKELPARADIDRKLERYKRERENLGGVNLRADEELNEIAGRLEEIGTEREDCEAAIRKLRTAIGGLNREARTRLKEAFDQVNANFGKLFTRLFNGGQAELRLIESDDVLEAGLEIFASPPGKKLASMSLMSGGEQALTATALIFAVFMANPAPVCVLDEVDAPLDDANTERFCRLLHEMAQETETRFIVITHHALSMSRMDRLFGVTMIERGVSQLVSVDLQRAAQMAAE